MTHNSLRANPCFIPLLPNDRQGKNNNHPLTSLGLMRPGDRRTDLRLSWLTRYPLDHGFWYFPRHRFFIGVFFDWREHFDVNIYMSKVVNVGECWCEDGPDAIAYLTCFVS